MRKGKVKKIMLWLESKTQARAEFKRSRNEMRRKLAQCKHESHERWGQRILENSKENKKLLWRQVKVVKKAREKLECGINDRSGTHLTEEAKVKERWEEHFEELPNVSEDREIEVMTLGARVGSRRVEWGQINEKEVKEAVAKLKLD